MIATPFPIKPRRLAGWLLSALGWRHDFLPPPAPRVLVVVYPHTSNWDFFWGILARWASGWPIRWVAKHTLFFWPLGGLLKAWGGIPVNRAAAGGFIESLVADIERRETLILSMAPEGTRARQEYWKSGFLRIAHAANLELGIGYIDFATRTIGIREYMRLSGDEAADMAHIAKAYEGIRGYRHEQAGPIRLRPPGA